MRIREIASKRMVAVGVLVLMGACAPAEDPPAAPPPPDAEPALHVTPRSGPVGAQVELHATGLPPNEPVEIGFGPVQAHYDPFQEATTDAAGELRVTVRVPDHAEAGRDYAFVVAAEPRIPERRAVSDPFRVTGS